jgi:hypothetical protein
MRAKTPRQLIALKLTTSGQHLTPTTLVCDLLHAVAPGFLKRGGRQYLGCASWHTAPADTQDCGARRVRPPVTTRTAHDDFCLAANVDRDRLVAARSIHLRD